MNVVDLDYTPLHLSKVVTGLCMQAHRSSVKITAKLVIQ